MVCGVGIYDVPKGWAKESELNERIYNCWSHMINRCYNEKTLKKRPTYNDCYVCEEWLFFSNFIRDIKLIEGYDLWVKDRNMALDKDLKSDGDRCYSLKNCKFISKEENTKQINKTRKWRKQQKIIQYDVNMNLIKIFNGQLEAQKETGVDSSSISKCCRGLRKTAGGYVWKYYKEQENKKG